MVPPPSLPPKKMAHVTASAWDVGNGFDSLLHTQIPGDTGNVFQYSCPREWGAFPSDGARGAVPRDGRRSGVTSVACFDWRNTGGPCRVTSGLPKQGFIRRSAQTLPENQGITLREHEQWGAPEHSSASTNPCLGRSTAPPPSSHPCCLRSKQKTTQLLQLWARTPCHGVFMFCALTPAAGYPYKSARLRSVAPRASSRLHHLLCL